MVTQTPRSLPLLGENRGAPALVSVVSSAPQDDPYPSQEHLNKAWHLAWLVLGTLYVSRAARLLGRSGLHGTRWHSRGREQGGGMPRLWRESAWHDWDLGEGWSCRQQRDPPLRSLRTHPSALP